jgi:hypothetical protein
MCSSPLTRAAQLAALALRHAMPTMFQFRGFAAAFAAASP